MTRAAPAWPAIAEATAADLAARVPFSVAGRPVGSVARAHLEALSAASSTLRPLADGRAALAVGPAGVDLRAADAERDAVFADLDVRLHRLGLVRGWRGEPYPVVCPGTGERLARTERAASRFWGTLTFGAHATGWVAGPDGRPAHLWIARRSLTKATDPGKLDNLIGGGVPDGQSALETLVREGWEEAGLTPAEMAAALPGRLLRIVRDIPEGLQHEWLHSFDLELPPGLTPHNQDGEVASFECLPVEEALRRAAGDEMTVDAALVTLDFALRHRLLPAGEHAALAEQSDALWAGRAGTSRPDTGSRPRHGIRADDAKLRSVYGM